MCKHKSGGMSSSSAPPKAEIRTTGSTSEPPVGVHAACAECASAAATAVSASASSSGSTSSHGACERLPSVSSTDSSVFEENQSDSSSYYRDRKASQVSKSSRISTDVIVERVDSELDVREESSFLIEPQEEISSNSASIVENNIRPQREDNITDICCSGYTPLPKRGSLSDTDSLSCRSDFLDLEPYFPTVKFYIPSDGMESPSPLGPICRICHLLGDDLDPLISPCRCSGTMQYIHNGCLVKWLEISQRKSKRPACCELCQYQYHRHKKFKIQHWQWPKCSRRDKILHMIFLLALLVMLACAVVTVLCFQQDKRGVPPDKTKLTKSEVVTLSCGVLFFIAFFVAMYVEVKAKNTMYRLLVKFVVLNQTWYIDEYDKNRDIGPVEV